MSASSDTGVSMTDKAHIIYGHLACTDYSFGFLSFDGKTWRLDEEAAKKHFAAIANAGANAVRVLPYAVWEERPQGRKSQFCPYVLDAATNLWNLSKWNPEYFAIMCRLIEIINSYGMEVWFALFDSCQLQPGAWTAMSPWKHNTQGIATFYDTKADTYAKAWVRKAFTEFAGCRMFWPWGNELNQAQFPAWARRVLFPLIRELSIPFDRMTYGAILEESGYLGQGEFADDNGNPQDTARKYFGEDFPPERNKFLLIREVHGCGRRALDEYTPFGPRPAQADYWWAGKPVGPYLYSDDGTKDQGGVDGGRPSPERWKAMAAHAFAIKNVAGVEHLPEGGDLAHQVAVIEAISAAYKAKFGEWPTNYGKWHYEPPVPPEPEPEPPTPPTPPAPPESDSGVDWRIVIAGAIALALALLLILA